MVVPFGSGYQEIDVSGYGPDLSNDTDSDGPPPTLVSSGNPGSVWAAPGQTVSYGYTIQDNQGVPATGTVTISIVEAAYVPPPAPNSAPTAGASAFQA